MNALHSLELKSRTSRRQARLKLACARALSKSHQWVEQLEDRVLLTAWTVMVYLDGDNNVEQDAINDFAEMAAVNNPNVNILVEMDRAPGGSTDYGDWTDTKRFKVTQGMTPTAANQLSDLGEQNMGDPNTLSSFINWGRSAYPADHYAVMLWDHGGGWRAGVCEDDTSNDILDTVEVHSALDSATSSGANKIDVVAMDACEMGQLEVAYTLKDYANYYVASADNMPVWGWEYDSILNTSALSTATTPNAWAQTLVNSYAAEYEPYNAYPTIMAINNSYISTVAGDLSSFSSTLINNMSTERANIKAAWDASRRYGDYYLDLYDFAMGVSSRSSNVSVKNAASTLTSDIDSHLLVGNWQDADYSGTTPNQRSLSVYFPTSATDQAFPYYSGTYLYFLADIPGYTQHWDEFLQAYFYGDPPAAITPGTGSWVHLNEAGDYSYSGSIASETAVDLFGFVPQTTGTYEITTGLPLDTEIRLYNSAGTQLGGTINSTTGGETVTQSFNAGSWYYIAVAGTKLAKGPYTLSIDGPEQTHTALATPAPGYSGTVTGSISSGETDYYQLTIPAGMHRLSIDASPSSGLDTVLQVFDASGTGMGVYNLAGIGSPDQVNNIAVTEASTCYVAVIAASRSQAGAYTLSATLSSGLLIDPDDQISEAIPLDTVPPTVTYIDQLDTPTDVDLYRIVASAGQRLAFDIDTPPSGGLGDSYLRLFDAAGNQIAYNDDGAGGLDSYLDWTFTADGTYYIGVSGFPNSNYNPITGGGDVNGATGAYALRIYPIDPDDQLSEATMLSAVPPKRVVSASIEQSGDVDMYAFTVSAGRTLSFDIDPGATSPLPDSYIRLFDNGGSVLAENDDGAAPGEDPNTFDSYLTYTFTTPGTYYLGVSGYGNSSYDAVFGELDGASATGSYVLTIDDADPNDQISEATPLANIESTHTVTDTIDNPQDVDMYSVTVSAGERVTFNLNSARDNGLTDSYLRLFDSAGNQIDANDDGPTPGESFSADSYIDHIFKTAGTYYVGVSGFPNYNYDPVTGDNDYPYSTGATGGYDLVVTGYPDVTPPIVAASPTITGGRQTSPKPSVINVSFSEDVFDTLTLDDIRVHNITTGTDIAQSNMSLSVNHDTKVATITFPGLPNAVLPDARYYVKLISSGITDFAGHALDGNGDGVAGGDYIYNFNLLTGDANGDGAINFTDLVAVAQNYDRTGGMTPAQGDFTGDGSVSFADLVIVAQHYGTSLPAAPPLSAASSAAVPALATSSKAAAASPASVASPPAPVKKPASKNILQPVATPTVPKVASLFSATRIHRNVDDLT